MGTIGLVATGCFSSRAPAPALPTANSPKADSSTIELLIATRLWNTTEPCGCTSTPLGDVARIAALLKSSPDRSLLLDAGGLRYEPKVLSASKLPQARLKADFIEKTWQELSAVVMVQSEDLRGEQGLAELVGRVAVDDAAHHRRADHDAVGDLADLGGLLGHILGAFECQTEPVAPEA